MSRSALRKVYPHVMKPLLKRFADPVEKCRELALKMTASFMTVIANYGEVLPYVFPSLMDRASQCFGFDMEQKCFVRDIEEHEAARRGVAQKNAVLKGGVYVGGTWAARGVVVWRGVAWCGVAWRGVCRRAKERVMVACL